MTPERKGPGPGALGPGREFDLIRRFLAHAPPSGPRVVVGPGDDAAVVGDGWVLSTDLSVEDVHFRRGWLTDEEVGFRAATAALSDLAAMAAEPVGVLVSMAYPPHGSFDPEAVTRGVQEAASRVGASVLGGDLSRSPGPLVVDVTVVGWAAAPALRSGAAAGDEVWVTGALGGSAAAVEMWRRGAEPPPVLRDAFARPTARVDAARALVGAGVVRALVDLSDGLAGDAGHLAAAGGVKVVVDPSLIPLVPEAVTVLGRGDALRVALHGGEDYELCFVAPSGAVDPQGLGRKTGVPLTRVGWVEEGSGVWLLAADGSVSPMGGGGFDHLAEDHP